MIHKAFMMDEKARLMKLLPKKNLNNASSEAMKVDIS